MKPTSSKGRSPWKVKKGGGIRGGIVIPNGGIVVNQGLRKVKLEEDYVEQKPDLPVAMEIEEDATSSGEISGEEVITEEFEVTKVQVEADNQMSSEEVPVSPRSQDGSGGSCSCGKDIESLKLTVKMLSLKVDKQNQVIRDIKIGLRNAVMSLMTCCKDDDGEQEDEGRCQEDGSEELQESPEKTSGATAKDSVVSETPIVIHWAQSGVTQEECDNAAGKDGGQIPDVTSNQPCISFSIVDHGPSTVIVDKNVDMEEDNCSNLTGNGGAIEADQYQDPGTNKNLEDDHHVDKLEQALASWETAESEGSQDNLEVEDLTSSNAIVEVNGDESGGQIPDEFAKQSAVSLETEKIIENDSVEDELEDGSTMADKEVSSSGPEESFVCSECGKVFKKRRSLHSHMGCIHSKTVPMPPKKCHSCPKVFKDWALLKAHIMMVHEGVRYKCDYCPAKFANKHDVLRHENRIHTKECPPTQKCEICGAYLLNTKWSLSNHMYRVHKKFASRLTAKESTSGISRKKKVETREEEKTVKKLRTIVFQCQHCPLSFPKREYLHDHLRKIHGITPPDC